MNLFGFGRPTKKERISTNRRKGLAAETEVANSDAIFGGWATKKRNKGLDFEQNRFNILTGKNEKRFKEIKSGNAKLSKYQKKEFDSLKKQGHNVSVDRRDPIYY